ncbi:TPA: 1-(5-phosphoribosyl)-5-[(5-phosphoribosylamino)methylideneamino]imidazole-4-carboxamide isomerase [Candidatus Avacholeplasma faecigallinarum]|nr:1-(5-phosphoribosyl)-5-[(5-phosphoribosylamino)methylideneamino]imidazole-4-carboxamide isomerase [Candidatus Avacholeplasma faecigallinarum]
MKIYPAIDLHLGKCVRLYKGDYNEVTDYGNPIEVAKKFKKLGATFLHIVDLDGAKEGSLINVDVVRRIIDEVKIDCEFGGGIRSLEQIKMLLNNNIKRVIIGSKALDLDFVDKAIKLFGSEKIVIGLDCENFMIKTNGWLEQSSINALDFALKLEALGVKTIIFTDISKDGTLDGINDGQIKRLVETTKIDIIASGGAKDISDIKKAQECGCKGIILGKSIYNNNIDLKQAIEEFEG